MRTASGKFPRIHPAVSTRIFPISTDETEDTQSHKRRHPHAVGAAARVARERAATVVAARAFDLAMSISNFDVRVSPSWPAPLTWQ